MRLQELKPRRGARNTITLGDGVRYVYMTSKKFICPRCRIFCGELVPVVDGRLRERLKRQPGGLLGNLPQTKVYCFNGCHEHPAWGWQNFNWTPQDEALIRSWPAEWRDDWQALEKERIIRQRGGTQ